MTTLAAIEASQPKRTMMLTVHEFKAWKGEEWSQAFTTRVGIAANKLYRSLGKKPRKRRLKIAGRNATNAYPHGILEQAFAQVQADVVAIAEKFPNIKDWIEQPACWPGERLRTKADDAADKLIAEFPGLTRAAALAIHREERDTRRPRVYGTGGPRETNSPANMLNQMRAGLADAVRAEYGADLARDDVDVLVRDAMRNDPELAATMARLEMLARTRPKG
jgi:hypothetical protein